LTSENQELLSELHQLRDIFAEERERRVRDDDVRLHQQFDAFGRAEVAVTLQLVDADLLRIGNAVAVLVAVVDERDRALAVVLRKEVRRLVLVARRDEALQPQRLELEGEVVEEVGDARIVAVAQDRLATFSVGLRMRRMIPERYPLGKSRESIMRWAIR